VRPCSTFARIAGGAGCLDTRPTQSRLNTAGGIAGGAWHAMTTPSLLCDSTVSPCTSGGSGGAGLENRSGGGGDPSTDAQSAASLSDGAAWRGATTRRSRFEAHPPALARAGLIPRSAGSIPAAGALGNHGGLPSVQLGGGRRWPPVNQDLGFFLVIFSASAIRSRSTRG
jgi:hypothetical protein